MGGIIPLPNAELTARILALEERVISLEKKLEDNEKNKKEKPCVVDILDLVSNFDVNDLSSFSHEKNDVLLDD